MAHVCAVIGLRIAAVSLHARGRGAPAQEALWELSHRVNARYIFEAVHVCLAHHKCAPLEAAPPLPHPLVKEVTPWWCKVNACVPSTIGRRALHFSSAALQALGGFYVKLAQGASVVSALPEAFGLELSKLQDAMPPDTPSQVEAVLRQDLGAGWRELVSSFDPTPLGSATIAQVHRAKLRVGGGDDVGAGAMREVDAVLKVQHYGVGTRLELDIGASTLLAWLLGSLFPHLFRDLGAVVREIAAITRAELDFRAEASNQARPK